MKKGKTVESTIYLLLSTPEYELTDTPIWWILLFLMKFSNKYCWNPALQVIPEVQQLLWNIFPDFILPFFSSHIWPTDGLAATFLRGILSFAQTLEELMSNCYISHSYPVFGSNQLISIKTEIWRKAKYIPIYQQKEKQ